MFYGSFQGPYKRRINARIGACAKTSAVINSTTSRPKAKLPPVRHVVIESSILWLRPDMLTGTSEYIVVIILAPHVPPRHTDELVPIDVHGNEWASVVLLCTRLPRCPMAGSIGGTHCVVYRGVINPRARFWVHSTGVWAPLECPNCAIL